MNEKHLVVKHNKLIESQGRLTALEQKLFLSTIATIGIDDEDFKEYHINVKEFKKTLGISTKALYKKLDEATDTLASRLIKIEKIVEDNKISRFKTTLFSSVEYVDGEGYIKVLIDPKLKPYLIKLSEQFTRYELENIISLRSTHSIRIYELLKQYQTIKKRSFAVEDLKLILGIENDYSRFFDFEKRVLIPAKTEINEKTDILIDYEKIRKGRRIGEIKFTIEPNEVDEDQALMEALSSDQERMAIRVKCGFENEKFSDKQVMELYEIACKISDRFNIDPYAYIKLNHEYMQRQSDVKSRFAYLKKAIGEDFAGAAVKIVMGEQK